MPSLARFLLLGTLLVVSGSRTASAEVMNIFLQLDGVPGESVVQDHKKWIAIESFSDSILGPLGAGGKASHSDLMLTKRLDSASLPLILRCNKGELIPSATLDFTRLVGGEVRFYQVRLADVRITSISVSGAVERAADLREQITLSYRGIQVAYTEFAPTGQPLPDLFSWWNVPANVGGDSAVACVTATPSVISGMVGTTNAISVAIPPLLTTTKEAAVMLISEDPSIASFVGGANGQVAVVFPMADPSPRTAQLVLLRPGTTTVRLVRADACIADRVTVEARGSLLRNPSFEDNYPLIFPHYGPISGWSGAERTGVSRGDGPFHDNGAIPDRSQVAFLQGTTFLAQPIEGLEPGRPYWLQFRYNARNCCGGTIGFAVRFDGNTLGIFSPVTPVGNANPYQVANLVFVPTASAGLLEFSTWSTGDASLLLDALTLVQRDPEDVVLRNPSFEASGLPPLPGYLQPAPLEGWIGTGHYGVNFSGSGPFADNGDAPDQEFVAFLQDPGSSLSQTVGGLIVGEDYTLTFAANARSGNTPHLRVSFADRVLVDEEVTPVGGTSPYLLKTAVFKAPAADGLLRFEQTAVGDSTVLLDDVRLVRGVLVPPSVALTVMFTETHDLRVSWTATAVGFKLQATSTLGGIWQDSAASVAVEGAENAVYVTPNGQAQYFRLHK